VGSNFVPERFRLHVLGGCSRPLAGTDAPARRHVGMVVHAAYVKLNDYVCVRHPNCPNVSYITTKCPALLILCEHEDGGVGLPSAVFDTTDTFARPNAQVT
jgi:hypothetical protein